MRILIAILLGLGAGLLARKLTTSPVVAEVTAPAPSYSETHEKTVEQAKEFADRVKREQQREEQPLNPAYPEKLYVRGYIVRGNRVNVYLSDGTTWTEHTPGLEQVERKHVVFRGKTYAVKAPDAIGSASVEPVKALPAQGAVIQSP